MGVDQEGQGPVVGDDGSLETPGVAQDFGQQPAARGGCLAVDVGVRVHDGPHTRRDEAFERREDHVEEFAAAHVHRGVVAAAHRGGVPGEVLEGRVHPDALQPGDIRLGQLAHQVRVFAVGLLAAAPAVVTDDVDDGGEALVDSRLGHVGADGLADPADQRGVEGGRHAERGGVDGGAVGGEAGQALVVGHRRDVESALRHDLLLVPGQQAGVLQRGPGQGAVGAGELAQAVPGGLVEVADAAEVVAARSHFGAVGLDVLPGAAQLRDLLRQGEPGEQCFDAVGDGQGGVGPGAVALLLGEAAVVGHGGRHSRLLGVARARRRGRAHGPAYVRVNCPVVGATWRNRR